MPYLEGGSNIDQFSLRSALDMLKSRGTHHSCPKLVWKQPNAACLAWNVFQKKLPTGNRFLGPIQSSNHLLFQCSFHEIHGCGFSVLLAPRINQGSLKFAKLLSYGDLSLSISHSSLKRGCCHLLK